MPGTERRSFYSMSKPCCCDQVSKSEINISLGFLAVFISICPQRASLEVTKNECFLHRITNTQLTVPLLHGDDRIQIMMSRKMLSSCAVTRYNRDNREEERAFGCPEPGLLKSKTTL